MDGCGGRSGPTLRELCRQRGIELMEALAMPDHFHLCRSIPPKYSVAHAIELLNRMNAVRIRRSGFRTAG